MVVFVNQKLIMELVDGMLYTKTMECAKIFDAWDPLLPGYLVQAPNFSNSPTAYELAIESYQIVQVLGL